MSSEVEVEVEKPKVIPKKTQKGKATAKPKVKFKLDSCRAPDSDDDGEIQIVLYPDVSTDPDVSTGERLET